MIENIKIGNKYRVSGEIGNTYEEFTVLVKEEELEVIHVGMNMIMGSTFDIECLQDWDQLLIVELL